MMMHNPPHPGEILREDVLPELGLSVTQAADQLGVTRDLGKRIRRPCVGLSAAWSFRSLRARRARGQGGHGVRARGRSGHGMFRSSLLTFLEGTGSRIVAFSGCVAGPRSRFLTSAD